MLVYNINDRPVRIRIAAISPDANDRTVLLHDFQFDDTDTPLCRRDPNGKQLGFPLAGRSTPEGRLLEAEPNAFELIVHRRPRQMRALWLTSPGTRR